MRDEVDAVDRDRARRRLVEAAQQLHERRLARAVLADDRDDRSGGELEVDVVEHEAVGAGIAERDVFEADAVVDALGHGLIGALVDSVARSPRATRGGGRRRARCRAGTRSRRRSRRRTATAGCPAASTSSTAPTGASRPDVDEHDRADVRAAEDRPRDRVPRTRSTQRARRDRRVPVAPMSRVRVARRAAAPSRARAALPCRAARSCPAGTV